LRVPSIVHHVLLRKLLPLRRLRFAPPTIVYRQHLLVLTHSIFAIITLVFALGIAVSLRISLQFLLLIFVLLTFVLLPFVLAIVEPVIGSSVLLIAVLDLSPLP